MAKKIIKEPTIRRYRATCPICGCEFEFDTTDARWFLNRLMNGMWGVQLHQVSIECHVSCPTCKTTLIDMQTLVKE